MSARGLDSAARGPHSASAIGPESVPPAPNDRDSGAGVAGARGERIHEEQTSPIGRGMAVAEHIPGANGGTLLRHPKGSNGGVHRGPDNFPRKNVLRAVVMMSLAAMGYRPEDLPRTLKELQARRRKSHRKLVPAAMAHLMVRANMNIVEEAAMGNQDAYGRFLQLQRDFHQIMAGGNDGNGHGRNGGGQPFPSKFVSQRDVAAGQPAPAPPEPQGPPFTIDGQEYVGVDV